MASTKPEHMAAAEMERARSLKIDPKVMDCFWKLADVNDDTRIQASLWLSDELKKLQHQHEASEGTDSLCAELQYSVKRLLKGLSSARKAARLGFYTALTEVLLAFPVLLPSQLVFKLIGIVFSSKQRKEEGKHTVIGQCLAYSALIRSGSMAKDDPNIGIIVKVLCKTCKKNTSLETFCCDILNTIFLSVDESSFKAVIFPSLNKVLTSGWVDASPVNIWILFRTVELFPNVVDKDFLAAHWGSGKLIRKKSFPELAKIMMKSTHAHPDIHPVALAINNASIRTSAFVEYWKQVVIEPMVGNQKEKTYLAYELLQDVLPKLKSSDQVTAVFAPNLIRNFIHNLSNPNSMLRAAANRSAYFLSTVVKNWKDEEMQYSLVRQLLDDPGLMNFDQVTQTQTISTMLQSFQPDGVKLLTDFLKATIAGSPSTDNQTVLASDNKRWFATQQLVRLVGLRVMSKEIAWQTDVLKFLLLHAYFSMNSADKKILKGFSKIEPVSEVLQGHLSEGFLHALETVTRQSCAKWRPSLQSYCSMIYNLVSFANDLLHSQSVMLHHPFEKKTLSCWDLMWKTVADLSNFVSDTGDSSEGQALQQLMLQMALQLFTHAKDANPVIEEVTVCCSMATKKQKYNEEVEGPEWKEVVVDLLLSLLSQGRHTLRPVVLSVFSLLVPTISTRSLQPVLDVIDPEASRDDGDDDGPLMPQEESDYEDENTEDEGDIKKPRKKRKAKDSESEESDSTDSESNSDLEEESGDVEEELKADLRAAIGDAAEMSDKDLSDMDDEEMTKVDEALAEVFRLRKKKKEVADLPLMHFRIRCLDLIDVVTDFYPAIPLVAACVVPLMSTITYGLRTKQQDPLYNRAATTLRNLAQVKKFPSCDGVDHPDYFKIWQQLLARTEKASDPQTVKCFASAAALLYRCVKSLPPKLQKGVKATIVSDCQSVLSRFFTERSCHIHPTFFSAFLAELDFTSELLETLLEFSINPDVSVFKRTQGLKMLRESLRRNPNTLNEWTDHQWDTVARKLSCYLIAVLGELMQGSEAKPKLLSELLNATRVFVQQHERKYAKPLLLLPPDIMIQAYSTLPREAKKLLKKILPSKIVQMLVNLSKSGPDVEKAKSDIHKAVKQLESRVVCPMNLTGFSRLTPTPGIKQTVKERTEAEDGSTDEDDDDEEDDEDDDNDDASKSIQKDGSILKEPEENIDGKQSIKGVNDSEKSHALKGKAHHNKSISKQNSSMEDSSKKPARASVSRTSEFSDKASGSESEHSKQSEEKLLSPSLSQNKVPEHYASGNRNISTIPLYNECEPCRDTSNKKNSKKMQSAVPQRKPRKGSLSQNRIDVSEVRNKRSSFEPSSKQNASLNMSNSQQNVNEADHVHEMPRLSVSPSIDQNELKSLTHSNKKVQISDMFLSYQSGTDSSLLEPQRLSFNSHNQSDDEENLKLRLSTSPLHSPDNVRNSPRLSNKKLRLSNSRFEAQSGEKVRISSSPPKETQMTTSSGLNHTRSSKTNESNMELISEISPQQFYRSNSAEQSSKRRKSNSQSEDVSPSPKRRRSSKSLSFVSSEHQSNADSNNVDTSDIAKSSKRKKVVSEKSLKTAKTEETASSPNLNEKPNSSPKRNLRSNRRLSNKNAPETNIAEIKEKSKVASKPASITDEGEDLSSEESPASVKKTERKALEAPKPNVPKKQTQAFEKKPSTVNPRRSLRLRK